MTTSEDDRRLRDYLPLFAFNVVQGLEAHSLRRLFRFGHFHSTLYIHVVICRDFPFISVLHHHLQQPRPQSSFRIRAGAREEFLEARDRLQCLYNSDVRADEFKRNKIQLFSAFTICSVENLLMSLPECLTPLKEHPQKIRESSIASEVL
jgi:hypothetical protein